MADIDMADLLDSLEIAARCPASWDAMDGDDKVRFCKQCRLNVYNISAMTTEEDEQLLLGRGNENQPCVRFFRREDGTVHTRNCPIGLRRLRGKCVRLWLRVAAAALWLFGLFAPTHAQEGTPCCWRYLLVPGTAKQHD